MTNFKDKNSRQYIFDITLNEDYNENDFLVSECNKNAYEHISNYKELWGINPYKNILLLTGPESSGKTYLCKILNYKTNAIFINKNTLSEYNKDKYLNNDYLIFEDINKINSLNDEKNLLHFFNHSIEKNIKILFTSKIYPLIFSLPDLKSRINSINHISINQPDDNLIEVLINKNFSKLSIRVSDSIIKFLIYNIPREYKVIKKFIISLNNYILKTNSKINLNSVKKFYNEYIN